MIRERKLMFLELGIVTKDLLGGSVLHRKEEFIHLGLAIKEGMDKTESQVVVELFRNAQMSLVFMIIAKFKYLIQNTAVKNKLLY